MSLVLYKVDRSPPVRAVLMTIEILELKYKSIEVNTLAGEHLKPEYLEKNPMHTVPLLEDGKFSLADSHAIITYLVSKYGADKREDLYPNDLGIRATINQRLYFDAGVLFPKLMAISRPMFRKETTGPSPQQVEEIEETYGILESYLRQSKFLAGKHLSLADISIVATISTYEILIPITNKYPRLLEWLNILKNCDFYKKANVPGLLQIKEILEQLSQGI
ncbi:glutathione S-transferase 1-like [Galleria mellonella]|uniref:Glutathione S-transferase 1-like n=1 Tax=Galleria mellonella TaxID=7137 RepID=A0A6J1X1M5_GALME|nr:glutathione S-transferase 1-like [Galleria mellonella]